MNILQQNIDISFFPISILSIVSFGMSARESAQGFWLFGYGYCLSVLARQSIFSDPAISGVYYGNHLPILVAIPSFKNQPALKDSLLIKDQHLPGYIDGYIRRFW